MSYIRTFVPLQITADLCRTTNQPSRCATPMKWMCLYNNMSLMEGKHSACENLMINCLYCVWTAKITGIVCDKL